MNTCFSHLSWLLSLFFLSPSLCFSSGFLRGYSRACCVSPDTQEEWANRRPLIGSFVLLVISRPRSVQPSDSATGPLARSNGAANLRTGTPHWVVYNIIWKGKQWSRLQCYIIKVVSEMKQNVFFSLCGIANHIINRLGWQRKKLIKRIQNVILHFTVMVNALTMLTQLRWSLHFHQYVSCLGSVCVCLCSWLPSPLR